MNPAHLRLWPSGFTARVLIVFAAAIAAQFIATSLLIGRDEANIQKEELARRIAEQLTVAQRVLAAVDPARRRAFAGTLSTRHLRLALSDSPPAIGGRERGAAPFASAGARDLRAAILTWEPGLGDRDLRLVAGGAGGDLVGAIAVEGGWLIFRTRDPVSEWHIIVLSVFRVAIAALMIAATAAILVRTLNRPLRRLSENARLIGTSRQREWEETGPRELRRVSRALNEMQRRIDGLIAQRTRALAAVGHDLRTPLARLRLRLPGIADPAERDAARRDCAEMERMLRELLEFYDTGDVGPRTRTDLASLCQTVAEDFADLGADVAYHGPERLVARVHYSQIVRALTNLVDNALKYAGSARIDLGRAGQGGAQQDGAEQGGHVVLTVSDEGPGIPEAEYERLRQPFERLEPSRGGAHGGIGLGLSIVDQTARLHGGAMELAPGRPRGLVVRVILPA